MRNEQLLYQNIVDCFNFQLQWIIFIAVSCIKQHSTNFSIEVIKYDYDSWYKTWQFRKWYALLIKKVNI